MRGRYSVLPVNGQFAVIYDPVVGGLLYLYVFLFRVNGNVCRVDDEDASVKPSSDVRSKGSISREAAKDDCILSFI